MSDAFTAYEIVVPRDWVDFNGHMTDSAYAVACSAANEAFLDHLGMSANYRARTGCGLYTVEAGLRWLRECRAGDRLGGRSVVQDVDSKRLRIETALVALGSGEPVFVGSYLYFHVGPGGVTPFPADRVEVLAAAPRS